MLVKVIQQYDCKCPMHMNLWTLKLVRITIKFLRISTSSVTSQASGTMLATEGCIVREDEI